MASGLQARRRTQAERSGATRRLLLDATVECLAERGYGGATTTEIADRAGVSRGAQLHHFPTKEELVIAAIEHVFTRRHQEYVETMARIPAGHDRGTAAIEKLWTMFSGPTFHAWLELLVAARTDAALRKGISGVAERFVANVERTFKETFPEAQGSPFAAVACGFTFALLQGLALENILEGRLSRERTARVLDAFRWLSELVLPGAHVSGPSRPAARAAARRTR